MDNTVLIYIEKDGKYLVLYRNKKENDLNQGKYVGIGGHIEIGETKEDAVIRETKEETGLTLVSFKYRAKILFENDDYSEIMYLFTSNDFFGTLIDDCDEGKLMWIDKNELPNLSIWEGDKAFLKLLNKTCDYFEMTLTYKNDVLVNIKNSI